MLATAQGDLPLVQALRIDISSFAGSMPWCSTWNLGWIPGHGEWGQAPPLHRAAKLITVGAVSFGLPDLAESGGSFLPPGRVTEDPPRPPSPTGLIIGLRLSRLASMRRVDFSRAEGRSRAADAGESLYGPLGNLAQLRSDRGFWRFGSFLPAPLWSMAL